MKKALPRILYGFLSASSNPINIALPWQPSDKDGLFKMEYSTTHAEYNNLKSWALTNKGERVMDFDFGLDAKRLLFEPIPVLQDKLINNARQQLGKYFPHLKIDLIELLTNEDDSSLAPNEIRLIIKAEIKRTQQIINFNEKISEGVRT